MPSRLRFNTSHMHFRTHTKPGSLGQAGPFQSPYHDTMIDHDKNVGQILKVLDDLGMANNTFVLYSTDNGPHMNSWPDGAMTPFRNEKNTNWEGAYRVPDMVRWPGKIKPGQVSNEMVAHLDWLQTLLAIVDAQFDYAALDPMNTGAPAYARRLLSAPFALAPFTFAAIHALRSADRLDPIGHFGLDSARRSIWARISSIWRRISSRASLSAAALVSAAAGELASAGV